MAEAISSFTIIKPQKLTSSTHHPHKSDANPCSRLARMDSCSTLFNGGQSVSMRRVYLLMEYKLTICSDGLEQQVDIEESARAELRGEVLIDEIEQKVGGLRALEEAGKK